MPLISLCNRSKGAGLELKGGWRAWSSGAVGGVVGSSRELRLAGGARARVGRQGGAGWLVVAREVGLAGGARARVGRRGRARWQPAAQEVGAADGVEAQGGRRRKSSWRPSRRLGAC
ncbi:unnamed protein product [Urochloa humidicola]